MLLRLKAKEKWQKKHLNEEKTPIIPILFRIFALKIKLNKQRMTRIYKLFWAVAGTMLCMTACNEGIESPVVNPTTSMSLTVNGESYEIDLTQKDTVNLRTLNVEFPTQFKIDNPDQFANLTIGGKEVKDGTCALQIDQISRKHQIEICYTEGGKEQKVVLNTLPKEMPAYIAEGKATSEGDFYLSFVYLRLIQKVDNQGNLLFYRFEPLKEFDGNSSGWWDFKKHHAADGKIYYSYHEPDDKFASWRFNGFNPSKRILLDESYHKLKEIQLEAANGIEKGLPVDGHDFYLFTPDHYILMSYIDRDTVVNGQNKVLASAYFQEVNNGNVVFDWWSLSHGELVEMTDPCFADTAGKDYVHMNSIDVLPDGNLLCSFRHISSALLIDRQGKTGNILWRLAGADNEDSYAFHGQHYARYHQDKGTITLFNNGNGAGRTQMLQFKVDSKNGELQDTKVLLDDGYYAQACGALTFSGDNMIVGWGIPGEGIANNRLLSEYDASGKEIFSISRAANANINTVLASYRSVKCE